MSKPRLRRKFIITCRHCQKQCEKSRPDVQYCSPVCSMARVKVKNTGSIPCDVCSTIFTPKSSLNKFCSKVCREKSIAEGLKRALPDKQCKMCPEIFKAVNGSHAYCSLECHRKGKAEIKKNSRSSAEKREQTKEYNKEYAKVRFQDKRELKNTNLMRCYGITIDQYEQMLEKQNYVCAICLLPPPGKHPLSVDHSHTTGMVRKLICVKCNNLLGNCDERLFVLDRAMDYIVEHEKLFEQSQLCLP